MTRKCIVTISIGIWFLSIPGAAQTHQKTVSLSTAAREALLAVEQFRMEQLRTELIEAKYQQALKQEDVTDQPFKNKDEAANATTNRPADEPEEVWKRYVQTSVAAWDELARLNARVRELTRQITILEKTISPPSQSSAN